MDCLNPSAPNDDMDPPAGAIHTVRPFDGSNYEFPDAYGLEDVFSDVGLIFTLHEVCSTGQTQP